MGGGKSERVKEREGGELGGGKSERVKEREGGLMKPSVSESLQLLSLHHSPASLIGHAQVAHLHSSAPFC